MVLKGWLHADAMVWQNASRALAASLLMLLMVGISPGGSAVEDDGDEVRAHYLTGGAFSGRAGTLCGHERTDTLPIPEPLNVQIGGGCDLRCPGNTCDITVEDDISSNVEFRVCFDGEPFCRPFLYSNHASVPGDRVRVVVSTEDGTHGLITIR